MKEEAEQEARADLGRTGLLRPDSGAPGRRRRETWSSASRACKTASTNCSLAQRRLGDETKRYKQLKDGFDVALRSLRNGATATGTEEVRRILETVKPKQAKELIVQMLPAPTRRHPRPTAP